MRTLGGAWETSRWGRVGLVVSALLGVHLSWNPFHIVGCFLSLVNPLSYEVDALRGLLINWPSHVGLDFAVLIGAVLVGVTTASSLVGRLAR